jgi:hypothetical protein
MGENSRKLPLLAHPAISSSPPLHPVPLCVTCKQLTMRVKKIYQVCSNRFGLSAWEKTKISHVDIICLLSLLSSFVGSYVRMYSSKIRV